MTDAPHHETEKPTGRYLAVLSLTALGVVYGDIGTSPLYAVRECFAGEHGLALTPDVLEVNVLGVLSLVVWSLIVVISLKYLAYVMRADNEGEGGILALMALALDPKQPVRRQWLVFILGLFGAALLYGDGAITPAISVLSAVEGVRVAAPAMGPFVVPTTIGILIVLFWFQRKGTAGVGLVFGPVTLLWFAVLIVLGVYQIAQNPAVLRALSPTYAAEYFAVHGIPGMVVLGSVFLVVTGGEALYADMGHFGPRPIRLAWFALVLPALIINYFGQGALILRQPEAAQQPLFHMAPSWSVLPLVALATAATVIASQAVISGTYSITRQAIMLGYAPRLQVEHTSTREEGQIYLPTINWGLLVVTVVLVVGFGSSTRLAAAYGIAVTTTMVITTVLAHVVARRVWGWKLAVALPLTLSLLVVDLAFLGANALKIADGGWVPLAMAMVVFVGMSTWKRGREYPLGPPRRADDPLGRAARVPGEGGRHTGAGDGRVHDGPARPCAAGVVRERPSQPRAAREGHLPLDHVHAAGARLGRQAAEGRSHRRGVRAGAGLLRVRGAAGRAAAARVGAGGGD